MRMMREKAVIADSRHRYLVSIEQSAFLSHSLNSPYTLLSSMVVFNQYVGLALLASSVSAIAGMPFVRSMLQSGGPAPYRTATPAVRSRNAFLDMRGCG